MKQLTLGTIMQLINDLQKEGVDLRELINMPVYIGNDDELNGIHCAWYAEVMNPDDESYTSIINMIDEDPCNIKVQGKSILKS